MQTRVFIYKRGETFSCKVVFDHFAGCLVYNDIVVPNNTPADVKKAFLVEAEDAVLKKVEETS